jgi:predicted PurR-regulated permease PerM
MSEKYAFKLNKKQGDMVARALSVVSFSVLACFGLAIFWGLLKFVSYYSSILLPPVVAIVLSMIFKPYYIWLYKHLWHKKSIALCAVFLSIGLPLIIFTYLFGVLLIEELVKLINVLPDNIKLAYNYAKETIPVVVEFLDKYGLNKLVSEFSLAEYIDVNKFASKLGGTTLSISALILKFIGGVLVWLVLPIYLAIFLSSRPYNGRDLSKAMIFLSPKTRENIAYLVDQFLNITVVYFRAQVLVAFIQGLLFAVLFHLVGLKYGLVIGMFLGILNIVPYLGNILGGIIIIPMALCSAEGWVLLVKLIVVFCSVQTLDSYFITPRVMKNRTGLNTFVIIFSLFFWSNVIGGALGMLLAIPLSAFIAVFWRLLKKEYFSDSAPDLGTSNEESINSLESSEELNDSENS